MPCSILMSNQEEGEPALHIEALTYLMFYAKDLNVMEAFYGGLLNLTRKPAASGWLEYELGPITLAFTQHKEDTQTLGPGSTEVVLKVSDIQKSYKELKDKGVNFSSAPHTVYQDQNVNITMAHLEDPEGHRLCLYQSVAVEK